MAHSVHFCKGRILLACPSLKCSFFSRCRQGFGLALALALALAAIEFSTCLQEPRLIGGTQCEREMVARKKKRKTDEQDMLLS